MELSYGVQASTKYTVEAYGPVALADLKQMYAALTLPWKRHRTKFRRVAVDKGGRLFVPVGTVWDAVKQMPQELAALLNGDLLWMDSFHNLVVTAGLNDLLDKRFKASGYTAADYVGLADGTPTFAAGDTMASHGGWVEIADYSQANRPALTLGTISGGSVNNSASKAQYSINGTATVGGAFVTTNNTKSGSTGTLYGGGAFSEGDRALVNGDTLNVQVTLTATAS